MPEREQIGGDHYVSKPLDTFDVVDAYDLDFYEGNVIKYVTRRKGTSRLEDLLKARHYLDIVIRHEQGLPTRPSEGEQGKHHKNVPPEDTPKWAPPRESTVSAFEIVRRGLTP